MQAWNAGILPGMGDWSSSVTGPQVLGARTDEFGNPMPAWSCGSGRIEEVNDIFFFIVGGAVLVKSGSMVLAYSSAIIGATPLLLRVATGAGTVLAIGKNIGRDGTVLATGKGTGRAANKLRPDQSAKGAHTTFKRDGAGQITHYQEWTPNPRNPSGFDAGRGFHGTGRPHHNLIPHVHDRLAPGGVRAPFRWEIPRR